MKILNENSAALLRRSWKHPHNLRFAPAQVAALCCSSAFVQTFGVVLPAPLSCFAAV